MKRSEMLERIADCIDYSRLTKMEMAENILKMQEDCHMLPPSYEAWSYVECRDVNEWEQEE